MRYVAVWKSEGGVEGGGHGVLSNVMGKWSVGCHYARGLSVSSLLTAS